jgi:hypothetical protein
MPWEQVETGSDYQYDTTGLFGVFQGFFGSGRSAAAQPPQYANPAPAAPAGSQADYEHLNSR